MSHTIVHFEIPADNPEKLKQFYENVFGWKIEKSPGPIDYWMISTVPVDEQGKLTEMGVNGGMMKRQNPEHKITNYILVESVDEYAKKIEDAGGKIIVPKTAVPSVGYWAMFVDPDGNVLAILEEDKEAR
ncbi:MAG: VOC family protein [Candidatus Hadarchaeaceae archaeon]